MDTNQIRTKTEMVKTALDELIDAVRENYYTEEDLKAPNYSEICEWLGWPDLQNGGQYEDAINQAAQLVLWSMA